MISRNSLPTKTRCLELVVETTIQSNNTERKVFIYKGIKNADYKEIFGSFDKNIKELSFSSKKQIKDFIKENQNLLNIEGRTHFLCGNLVYYTGRKHGDFDLSFRHFSDFECWCCVSTDFFVVVDLNS